MRTEISQAKKEANIYLQNVEDGKAIAAIEEKRLKKLGQVKLETVHVVNTLFKLNAV